MNDKNDLKYSAASTAGPSVAGTGAMEVVQFQEGWHWKKALSALITALYGLVAIANGSDVGATVIGVILVLLVVAATIVTKFWRNYQGLGNGAKVLAWAAFLPGAIVFWFIFGFIWVVVTMISAII